MVMLHGITKQIMMHCPIKWQDPRQLQIELAAFQMHFQWPSLVLIDTLQYVYFLTLRIRICLYKWLTRMDRCHRQDISLDHTHGRTP